VLAFSKGGIRMENIRIGDAAGYKIGTWHFPKTGWWILHIIGITGVLYFGWLFGGMFFS
jgi:hypothetical protein